MRLKNIAKWLVGTLVALVLAGALLILLILQLLLSDICENELLVRVISPGGEHQAIAFRRNCGATTAYSTHVSVIPAEMALPDETGNVLVMRGSDLLPKLHWEAPERLLVEYPVYIDAARVDEARGGVLIEYALSGAE